MSFAPRIGALAVGLLLAGWGLSAVRALNTPGAFEEEKLVTVIGAGPNAGGLFLPAPGPGETGVAVNPDAEIDVLDWAWDWPVSSGQIRIEATVRNPSATRWTQLLVSVFFDLTTPAAIPTEVEKPVEAHIGYAPQATLLTLDTPLVGGETRRLTTAVDAPRGNLPRAVRSYRNLWNNLRRFSRTPLRLWSPGMMLAPSLVVYGFERP